MINSMVSICSLGILDTIMNLVVCILMFDIVVLVWLHIVGYFVNSFVDLFY